MSTATPTASTAYPAEARDAGPTSTRTEKGVSLARGPALVLGTVLLAAGLYLLYRAHSFPKFSNNFPNGNPPADGKFIFGLFEANGWTAMLTAVAGGLLLFGAAQHLLAKTMSLVVGIALGAAAVIALISGNVLGLAAANHWTELAWAVCAVILLFNTLVPRRRRTVVVADRTVAADTAPGGETVTRTRGETATRTRTAARTDTDVAPRRAVETDAAPPAETVPASEPTTRAEVADRPVANDGA